MIPEEKQFEKNKSKIGSVLQSAMKTPYYQKRFSNLNLQEINSYQDFSALPVTTKDDYRSSFLDFIVPDYIAHIDRKALLNPYKDKKTEGYLQQNGFVPFMTSGSTGMPMVFLKHKSDLVKEFFIVNRYRNSVCKDIVNKKHLWLLPFNNYLKQTYYHMDENYLKYSENGFKYFVAEYNKENFIEIGQFIESNQIEWMIASPSFLARYAEEMHRLGIPATKSIQYLECTSEMLLPWQRDIIVKYFGIAPVSVYGANEMSFIGFSCVNDHFHLLSSNVFLEIVKKDRDLELLVTSLNYRTAPIIRYRVGDIGKWDHTHCEISGEPKFQLKGYRTNDKIIKENGALLEPWVFSDMLIFYCSKLKINTTQTKVIQNSYDLFTVLLRVDHIPDSEIQQRFSEYFRVGLSALMEQSVHVDVLYTLEAIPNDQRSKKYKYFVSEIVQ